MLIECIIGASFLITAAHFYRKKSAASSLNDFDRFKILCCVLPEELYEGCTQRAGDVAKVVLEEARSKSAKASEIQIEEVLSSLLGQVLGVPSQKISDPRQAFQEFAQSHPERVISLVHSQLAKWTSWPGEAKVAILILNLPPEVAAQVFGQLHPPEVLRITTRIRQLPALPSRLQSLWIQEFLGLQEPAGDLPAQATALALRDSQLFVKILRERWLQD